MARAALITVPKAAPKIAFFHLFSFWFPRFMRYFLFNRFPLRLGQKLPSVQPDAIMPETSSSAIGQMTHLIPGHSDRYQCHRLTNQTSSTGFHMRNCLQAHPNFTAPPIAISFPPSRFISIQSTCPNKPDPILPLDDQIVPRLRVFLPRYRVVFLDYLCAIAG